MSDVSIEWESDEDEDETMSVSQLPVVGEIVNKAKNMYGTVKDSNPAVHSVLNVAEGTLKIVGKIGAPIICTTVGCLAASALPAGAAQPVVGAVYTAARTGIKKLFFGKRR